MRKLIENFVGVATSAGMDFDNRPELLFVDSDLAYAIVSHLQDAILYTVNYSKNIYTEVAEINNRGYKIVARSGIRERK